MTDETTTPREQYRLLQNIARSVDSIDRNLDRMVDQFEAHFDDMTSPHDWANHGYDLQPHDRYQNGD